MRVGLWEAAAFCFATLAKLTANEPHLLHSSLRTLAASALNQQTYKRMQHAGRH